MSATENKRDKIIDDLLLRYPKGKTRKLKKGDYDIDNNYNYERCVYVDIVVTHPTCADERELGRAGPEVPRAARGRRPPGRASGPARASGATSPRGRYWSTRSKAPRPLAPPHPSGSC